MKTARIMMMVLALCAAGTFGAASMANAQPNMHGDNSSYYSMSPEAQAAMQKHWNIVGPLRQELFAKQTELDAKIASGADEASIQNIVKQVNELSAKLNEAQVKMRQQMAKDGMAYAGPMMHGAGQMGGMGYGHGMGNGHAMGCGW